VDLAKNEDFREEVVEEVKRKKEEEKTRLSKGKGFSIYR
jgi:hypothetical protein